MSYFTSPLDSFFRGEGPALDREQIEVALGPPMNLSARGGESVSPELAKVGPRQLQASAVIGGTMNAERALGNIRPFGQYKGTRGIGLGYKGADGSFRYIPVAIYNQSVYKILTSDESLDIIEKGTAVGSNASIGMPGGFASVQLEDSVGGGYSTFKIAAAAAGVLALAGGGYFLVKRYR